MIGIRRDVSTPLHIPADSIRGHLAADPFLADLLKRLKDGGRLGAMQARHFSLPTAQCPSCCTCSNLFCIRYVTCI